MRRSLSFLGIVAAYSFTGCVVASCPPDACHPVANGGTGGTSGKGGASGDTGNTGNTGNAGSGAGGSTDAGPPPPGEWVHVTNNLTGMSTDCGISGVWAKPDEDMLITGIGSNGLYASTDGGATWQALGTGKDSTPVHNRITRIIFDPDHADVFYESGVYNGTGVFRTDDDGKTFIGLDVQHNDSVAIDFTDPDRKTLIAGTHEKHNQFWLSTDRGATFTDIGMNLPDGDCTQTFVVGAQTFLVGCTGYGGGFTGIIRSTDGGTSWDMVSTDGGGPFPLRASDKSIYWPNVNGGVARSTDDGQSWTKMSDNGSVINVVELPDGRIASLSKDTLVISSDHGATWKVASPPLPSVANGVSQMTYSVHQKAFFGVHFACQPTVGDDSLLRYDFDFETR
jgi:hypothetical protein